MTADQESGLRPKTLTAFVDTARETENSPERRLSPKLRPASHWTLAFASIVWLAPSAHAQSTELNQIAEAPAIHLSSGEDASDDPAKKSKPELLVVPIPMSNPTLGAGLTVAGVLFYNPNGSSQPWVTAGGVFYTSNKSRGAAAVHSMSLDNDRIKVLMFGGYANLKINFYGIGASAGDRDVSVKMDNKGVILIAQGQYEIATNLYIGGRFQFLDLKQNIEHENPRFPDLNLPGDLLNSRISGIGPSITYDSRDNQFSPRKGAYVTLVGIFNTGGLGSDFTYNKWKLSTNVYFPITASGTLAVHGGVCAVSDNGPFYDLCMYGQAGDLRGYEMGRYRDGAMITGQVEWRQRLNEKLGAVFFAGAGTIASSLGDLNKGKFLPSAGMGLRYKASKSTGTNLRLDFAIGRDSNAIYFGIGEVF